MYQYVIDLYKKYIPAAQQYGVTISIKEHEYWLSDESPVFGMQITFANMLTKEQRTVLQIKT